MKQLVALACCLVAASSFVFGQKKATLPSRIAFGSCGSQDHPMPILDTALTHRPDVFVWLGDNIYGDSYDMNELRAKYAKLAAKPEFQRLKKTAQFLATWDDHDYGWNDSGKHYPFKNESKAIFMDFWEEPADSPRRQHEGIYTSYMYEENGKRMQVILLDNRTFRSDLRRYRGELSSDDRYFYVPDYFPHEITDSTLLGETQWRWLEAELRKPADLRIIGSGTQFSIAYNGYEAWANFPHERQRMLDLIKKTRANGVLFLTGDVHYAEVSVLREAGMYPIYDVTASGITSTWLFATPNENRIEGPIMDNHFGLLTIDWKQKDPTIKMEIHDVRGNQRIEHSIRLSQISFAK
jgi:alkaline phosphatase D